jgi:glycosyltransferase involved in cell wall biosynthesis
LNAIENDRSGNRIMKKVAFTALGREGWQAGFVYTISLLRSLRMLNTDDLNFTLLLLQKDSYIPEEVRDLFHEILRFPSYRRWTLTWCADLGSKRIVGKDLLQDLFLRRYDIRVIALGEAPRGSKIPTLSWLPDFQHIHLPEMFTPEECEKRNDSFLRIASNSTRVILLSDSVKRDFESFAPAYAHKARVARPASYIPATAYEASPMPVLEAYQLPEKFIYVPNQFWKHKNHEAVFHAVRLLKEQGLEVIVVCSGNLIDYRHPDYFSRLLQLTSSLGVRSQIIFLGLIPRPHVFALIRQSLCVLNPSLFEGFGLASDEARSLGKRMLLSDIDAHREQNPPGAIFFNPKDHEELAKKMAEVWRESLPGPDPEMELKARASLAERMKAFGEAFMSALKEVL